MALRLLRWIGIAVLVTGYAMLAHHTNLSPNNGHLGLWVALAPVALIALVLAWRAAQRWLMLGLVAFFFMALWAAWPMLADHHGMVYWLQHVGMQLVLFVIFGRTLVGGHEPLCTRFARVAHAPLVLSARHERYTRAVTWAWTLFFALIAIISSVLFFRAPLATWSFFANFLTLPLVIIMFVVEYRVRGWVLPQVPPISILAGVRAFRNMVEHPR